MLEGQKPSLSVVPVSQVLLDPLCPHYWSLNNEPLTFHCLVLSPSQKPNSFASCRLFYHSNLPSSRLAGSCTCSW